jgi:hypothetical protein
MYNSDMEKIMRKYPGRLTRARSIKLYCKEMCCAGDTESWRNCTFNACFLWNFRLGREVLGNQTSFKKHRQNSSNLAKDEVLQATKPVQEVLGMDIQKQINDAKAGGEDGRK